MKNKLITEIEQQMLKQLDNAQLEALHKALVQTLKSFEVKETKHNTEEPENNAILSEFLSAKRIEGYWCKQDIDNATEKATTRIVKFIFGE